MRKYFLWLICAIFMVSSVGFISWKPAADVTINNKAVNTSAKSAAVSLTETYGQYVDDIFATANLADAGLDAMVFRKAVTGYLNLKAANKLPQNSNIITVVDFSKSSRNKRMWIIDMSAKKLLLNTWVSHGQGSGNDMATAFSNLANSHQSSLGFYVTSEVYVGKHGRSLRLDGMDAGFNSNARARAIVVHAADYVCQNTINQIGRLGRSFGCPAVSPVVAKQVIDTIKGGNLLFINGNDKKYNSKYLDDALAMQFLQAGNNQVADAATVAAVL